MDGHRYADDAEPSWYSGSQYARQADPEVSGSHALGRGAGDSRYDSGVHERPSGAFRLPDQRTYDPVTSTGSHARAADPEPAQVRVPVRGPEYPAVLPAAAAHVAPVAEPTSLVPPVAPKQARAAESVYGGRRPVSSVIVAVGMAVLLVPVVRLLVSASFAHTPTAAGVVPAVLLALGYALTGVGLFAVSGGRPITRESWLRPPVAYLPAGLILLLAAGLAAA